MIRHIATHAPVKPFPRIESPEFIPVCHILSIRLIWGVLENFQVSHMAAAGRYRKGGGAAFMKSRCLRGLAAFVSEDKMP